MLKLALNSFMMIQTLSFPGKREIMIGFDRMMSKNSEIFFGDFRGQELERAFFWLFKLIVSVKRVVQS
ncbi:unnamed protein product [Paramecium pentaurelia]|uniref:Uncharacterized protein n=1 Tax=Paramecium pentaurelia TaxID=43138 RepID=A0A8S1WX67_9CILI|nr:unnamed protein product [Paramecium pentaurelia]